MSSTGRRRPDRRPARASERSRGSGLGLESYTVIVPVVIVTIILMTIGIVMTVIMMIIMILLIFIIRLLFHKCYVRGCKSEP